MDFEDPLIGLPEIGYPKSPYMGHHHFTENEARCFYGRGEEIKDIYEIVNEFRIFFFYGLSGVGKSSLLYAGLFPSMKKQGWEINYKRRDQKNIYFG